MKNLLQVLALGLVLFLGACSTAEGSFLKKVESKTAYSDKTMTEGSKIGSFSSDGKEFTSEEYIGYKAIFKNAIDENTAEYSVTVSGKEYIYTLKTTDGKTISTIDPSGTTITAWLK